MAEKIETIQLWTQGCKDPIALNYDKNATIPCADCCEYNSVEIVGCTDPLASNYNLHSNKACKDCCLYERTSKLVAFQVEPISLQEPTPKYTYQIDKESNICIKDSGYGPNWLDGGSTKYLEELLKITEGVVPNGFGRMTLLWDAFNTLKEQQPNFRSQINTIDLTPWIIPTYSTSSEIKVALNPMIDTFKSDCQSIGGKLYQHIVKKGEPLENEFYACGCFDDTQTTSVTIVEPTVCTTTSTLGNVHVIKTDDGSETTSTCLSGLDGYNGYMTLLQNQSNLGWVMTNPSEPLTIQRDFFNTFLLADGLGLSATDALFVVENFLDTTQQQYPEGYITGRARAMLLIKNGFINGGSIIIPLKANINTEIINTQTCCDKVGGTFISGVYDGPNQTYNTGFCKCSDTLTLCPKLSDGTIQVLTEKQSTTTTNLRINTNSEVVVTYIDSISEECCSNKSLGSNMSGTWEWDGSRCVLNQTAGSTECNVPTVITISETPIIPNNFDEVTISAYLYFTEPTNRCTDGNLNSNLVGTPLTQSVLNLLQDPPQTTSEVSNFSNLTWEEDVTINDQNTGGLGINQNIAATRLTGLRTNTNCCYDTETPIQGKLVLQEIGSNKVIDLEVNVEYVDTFSSQKTEINTNTNVGLGFNRWVRLTTTANISSLTNFNIGVEFSQGLFSSCDYDIYFDDIKVEGLQDGVREIYDTEECPGFKLTPVIDNKKSWVYNPGKPIISDDIYDVITRDNGIEGLIEDTNYEGNTGHGSINRTFAPSPDADLPFRDTDYFNFHGVVEKHSKLVLNTKEVKLQFNMCADDDCLINGSYLIDDEGNYIVDDDGGRIIVDYGAPFPNLLALERFKKTFQGFWVQFMEQFIPTTTIFVAGEKWCNSRICEEKVVADYLLDVRSTDDILSPDPVNNNVTEVENLVDANRLLLTDVIDTSSAELGTTIGTGLQRSTYNFDETGPLVIGNTKLYTTDVLDPDLGNKVRYRSLI